VNLRRSKGGRKEVVRRKLVKLRLKEVKVCELRTWGWRGAVVDVEVLEAV
jgi:hypothetical protein